MGSSEPTGFVNLRFYLAGAVAIVFAWCCFHGLAWLALSVGIVPILHYDPPAGQWILIGDAMLSGWHKIRITEDFTLAGYTLLFLTAVLTYYVTRLAYHRDFAKVFGRRDRWLIAGWMIGAPLIAAEGHALFVLVFRIPLTQQWPTFFGIIALGIFIASARLFAWSWGWVMRRCKVPR